MRLQRLKVEQLRQFHQPFEIDRIEPGLNLFVGTNEAGKSTLVRAIRAAFFERYRSSSVDDLRPWNDASAAPAVELDFMLGERVYRLRKSFLQRKRCELTVDSERLDGDLAEAHLSELLGFRFAAKGGSRPEHWGIPGLLWIEQGTAHEIDDPVGHATDHLRQALEQTVSEVASPQGDAIIRTLRSEREQLLTASTGRPTAVFKAALDARDKAEQRLAALDAEIAAYRQQVDQLAVWQAEQAADAKAQPWAAMQAQQRAAESALAASEALAGRLAADRASLDRIETTLRLLDEQLAGFDEDAKALQLREAEVLTADAQVEAAQAIDERRSAERQAAEAACHATAAGLERARQDDLRVEMSRRVDEADARIRALDGLIVEAVSVQTEIARLRASLAADTMVSRTDVERLREQGRRLEALRIRQEMVATRIRFELAPDVRALLDGEALQGRGERQLTAAASLEIDGVGRFEVVPGDDSLLTLEREATDLQAAHHDQLRRIGVGTLAAAESRYQTQQQATKDLEQAVKTLASLAPQGLDALRAEADAQAVRRQDAEALRAKLPAADTSTELSPVASLSDAESRHVEACRRLDTVIAQCSEARQALVGARAKQGSAVRERDALRTRLEDASRQQRAREAGDRRPVLRAERDTLTQAIDASAASVDAARPELLRQSVDRFRRSAEIARGEFDRRQDQIQLLKGRLEQAGTQGLEEERAELAVHAEGARRRCEELSLRAQALDLLLAKLDAKRQDLTRRLRAPLQQRIDHYIRLLFPKAALELDDQLLPRLLTRPGPVRGPDGGAAGEESGDVAELSHGAREQLGVLTRLAYADLLKEAGRPTLVILDDALVHSDDQRLAQMKHVLFDAAQRHQVLLFTCHPAAWRDMGVPARTIARSQAET